MVIVEIVINSSSCEKYLVTLMDLQLKNKTTMCIRCQKNQYSLTIKTYIQGFPGGTGDAGSSPGLGRSHMPWSNSAREPQLLSLRVWSLCSATRGRDSERPTHRDEEWPQHRDEEWPPLATTRESLRTETKTQHSHTYIHTYIHT